MDDIGGKRTKPQYEGPGKFVFPKTGGTPLENSGKELHLGREISERIKFKVRKVKKPAECL